MQQSLNITGLILVSEIIKETSLNTVRWLLSITDCLTLNTTRACDRKLCALSAVAATDRRWTAPCSSRAASDTVTTDSSEQEAA